MNILITGLNGFVGKNLNNYLLNKKYNIFRYSFIDDNLNQKNDINTYIHLAGKAHDLKYHNSNDYYKINTELTKEIFNNFLISNAQDFIFISTVKAVADITYEILTEDAIPKPSTDYGKSKLFAEEYILNTELPAGKRIFILRPCMIHGPHNKGNLNFLIKLIKNNVPWPLGLFHNQRSFCTVDNLSFIINEIITNNEIKSGIYNIADDEPLSTNELIILISKVLQKKCFIINIPKRFVFYLANFFDIFNIFLTNDRLQKLTENYLVSNHKIKTAIKKNLPFSTKQGLTQTIKSF
jgi:nucleoside-diphosphate-sugar epimerase